MKIVVVLFVLISNSIFVETGNISFKKYQKATIHFLDGTDLEGLAKVKTLLGIDTIKFKLYDDSEPDVWTQLMVKGITFHEEFEGMYFEYVILHITRKPRLLRVLEEGVISLYVDIENYWNFYPTVGDSPYRKGYREEISKFYVIRESEEKATFIASWRFRSIAKKYFSDCPELVTLIAEREFRWSDIGNIVSYYNDFCVD